jgi:hydroxymethylpyrimidine/phosphomethylpyrimidine kinase
MDLNKVTLPCLDYEASVRFYKKLGLTQIVHSPPRYARFETPSGSMLSIHSVAEAMHADTVIYFEVDDVDSAVQRRVA